MDPNLSRIRIPLRSMITKLCSKSQAAIQSNQENLASGILETLLNKIDELRILDKSIFESWNSDDDKDGELLEIEVEKVLEYDISSNAAINDLKKFLDKTEPKFNGNIGKIPIENAVVKLPKLELPHFSGTKTEWQSFWEIF